MMPQKKLSEVCANGEEQNTSECAVASATTTTVAVCAATGNQGWEVVNRLQELSGPSERFDVLAFTRNSKSRSATALARIPNVKVAQTDYTPETLREVFSSNNVDALFLNYVAGPNEHEIEARIVAEAIQNGVRHIVYSSNIACDTGTGVPHWESSFRTESYIREASKKRAAENGQGVVHHFVRLAHFNENILPNSYFSPEKGKLRYLWNTTVAFPTSSARDAARVVCKLFADPSSLPSGGYIDVVTEMVTAEQIALAVSLAKNETIKAVKGPWFFLTFGKLFGWMPKSLLMMAEYIENSHLHPDWVANLDHMPSFLGEELLKEEPLETIESFSLRHYGKAS